MSLNLDRPWVGALYFECLAPSARLFLPCILCLSRSVPTYRFRLLPIQGHFFHLCSYPFSGSSVSFLLLLKNDTWCLFSRAPCCHYPVKRALCRVTNISLLIEAFWNSFIRFNGLISVQWLPPVSTNGPGALLDLLHSIISHTVFVSILSPTYQILAWSLAHRRGGKENE